MVIGKIDEIADLFRRKDGHDMTIQIPDDLADYVRDAVASGRYASESEVLSTSLRLLQDCEQRDALRRDLQVGLDQLDRGERIPAAEVFGELRERAAELIKKSQ